MKKNHITGLLVLSLIFTLTLTSLKPPQKRDDQPNAGLTTPQGFKAIKLVEGLGKVRHLIVTSKGKIYARLARRYWLPNMEAMVKRKAVPNI